jgi:hypothetical protein
MPGLFVLLALNGLVALLFLVTDNKEAFMGVPGTMALIVIGGGWFLWNTQQRNSKSKGSERKNGA